MVWGEPGQDLQVVRGQAMNNAFSDIILTSGYAEGLGNVPMEVWGRCKEGGSPTVLQS